jgi:hypothetical protein
MSRPLHERLRQLETEVQHLQVPPAAAVRARGRRRGRQQMAGVMAGVAVVAATAGITATSTLDRPLQGATAPGPAAVSPAASCVLTLPPDPAGVRVRVLNGGAPAGLGDTTATKLRERGFTVLTHTDGSTNEPLGPTTLRYGPAAIGAAALLRAALIGDVTMRFDPDRSDDTIDLTLGTTFARLATSTEINQALVAAGKPSAPPEC